MNRSSFDRDHSGVPAEGIPRNFVLAIAATGCGIVLIAAIALLGYALSMPSLQSGIAGYPRMVPNAAAGFLLLGIGVLVRARTMLVPVPPSPWLLRVEQGAFLTVVAIGAITLLEYVFSAGPAFDEIIVRTRQEQIWNAERSRMAPLTALNFALLGAALLHVRAESVRVARRAILLALPVALSSLLVLIGYAFKQESVLSGIPYAGMAMNTSLAFVLLCNGMLFMRRDFGVVALLSDDGMSGMVARRVVPAALVLPILLEWLRDAGWDAGWYTSDFGSALVACIYLIAFGLTLWWLLVPVRRAEAARNAAQAALRENEERYRVFLDSISDLVYMKDSQYRHVISNKALNDFFGKPREEVIGKSDYELMTPTAATACRASDIEALGSHMIVRSEELVGDRWFETVKFPVPLANDETGVGSIIRDVNERKLAEAELIAAKERAERSDRLKDEFIANISHEIRTPLNVILGFADIVEETFGGGAGDEKPRMFASIRGGAERLTRTVDMILSFSRLKAGELTLHPSAFHLPSFLEDRVKEMRQRAEKKGLTIVFENQLGEATLEADAYCMSQVVGNLLENAIKYTSEGGVSLRLYADAEGTVCFDVRDTGIGISESYLGSLFMPYTQEEQGYTRSYEGIGLGLALVKRYLDLHGMDITVQSRKHDGSTFTVHLGDAVSRRQPVAAPHASPTETTAAHDDASLFPGELRQVLLVEDDIETVEYMRLVLQSHYEVDVADNRNEVMRLLAERVPDIVLMDISLQGDTHGLDIVRELRSTPAFAGIPVIAVTAHAFPADESACYDAGCDAYLPKPVSRVHLLETMASVLRGESHSRKKAD
jgi:PAS domain S-box-containing protein